MVHGSEVVVAAVRHRFVSLRKDAPPEQIDEHNDLRRQLGISDHALIIGHVGRFFAVKNHGFVVEIAEEALKRSPRRSSYSLAGDLFKNKYKPTSESVGLKDRCRILGERRDVPELMMQVFDALILPSRIEGVPVTMFEAQAAGIPSVVSDRVSRSAQVVPGLVTYVSLAESPSTWAELVLTSASQAKRSDHSAALATMNGTAANTRVCLERIHEVYESSILASVMQE
jgi:glycosyltransferase involved in cell wall biosynthesis